MAAIVALIVAFFITFSTAVCTDPNDYRVHFTTQRAPGFNFLQNKKATTTHSLLPANFNVNRKHDALGGNHSEDEEIDVDFNDSVSEAITGFGLKLLRVASPADNVVLSPFSIAASLALIQQGALGTTRRQLSLLLGMYPNSSFKCFKKLYTALEKRRSVNVLNVASAIFAQNSPKDHFTLNSDFGKKAIEDFHSRVLDTNFENVETATNFINKWVNEQTNGFIQRLITPGTLPTNTRLVLANAVFFRGKWKTPFDQMHTDEMDFVLATGETKRTPFMHSIGQYKAGQFWNIDGGATFVVLPFEGDKYSFMGILPGKQSNLDNLISNLNNTILLGKLTTMPVQSAKVTIPKFTIEKQFDLGPILKKMGATELFSPRSDISNIGHYNGVAPVISSAVHGATLIVDEEGATAAAATAFGATALTAHDDNVYFWADRPFLAILWDAQNSVPLFMARIEDPTVY